jgi:peroxiredoxin
VELVVRRDDRRGERARQVAVGAALAILTACAPPPSLGRTLPLRALAGTDGAPHPIEPDGTARFTVLVFFADHCPCQAAHDARLRDLYARYHPRGVEVFAVDSEVSATLERDRAEATKRAYPFPILIDPEGSLARSLGAVYATETFVVDRGATVRYHGGIDSDKRELHDGAVPFLRDALDDLLANLSPRRAESKSLGCALQTF